MKKKKHTRRQVKKTVLHQAKRSLKRYINKKRRALLVIPNHVMPILSLQLSRILNQVQDDLKLIRYDIPFAAKIRLENAGKKRSVRKILKIVKKTSLQTKKLSKKYSKQKTWIVLAQTGLQNTVYFWQFHKWQITTSLSILSLAGFTIYWLILKDMPNPALLSNIQIPLTTTIRARDGSILYRVYKSANRFKLTWDEIPDVVKKATIAIEDAEFYQHLGISPRAIMRALVYNSKQDNINQYQGGSTITQQLVKNRLLTPKKSYKRKIQEVILALLTERFYSKNQILTMYLNEVGYGGPAYGIEAASQMYFGKSARDLTLGEASFLAGLPAAPTTFSPFGTNPHLANVRQQQVLDRMQLLGMTGKYEFEEAAAEKLVFAPQKTDILAPHFVMYVKSLLSETLGENMVSEGGLDVTTTLDLKVQSKAEETVKGQITAIRDRFNIHNGAALVTNPESGEILAMVGSVDYFDIENSGYVNATTSLRQPGSSIKPVNYAYAFDHGFTPTTIIEDSPVVYTAPGSTEVYAPKNYDGKFHGFVTVRTALASSYNIPAVKTLNKMGVGNMIETGQAMGIKSWNSLPPIGLSLTLGGAEVTMLDMARVYGTLENMGRPKELNAILSITDSNNNDMTAQFFQKGTEKGLIANVHAQEDKPAFAGASAGKQVISPLSAYWLTDILADNVARLPAFGNYAKLTVPGHKVAVKTGTSNSYRDNWTIGYTPDYLVAVWVGNNDGSFMNRNLVSGITGAAPIWNEIMTDLLHDKPAKEFPVPDGLIAVKICATNGLLTCPYCPSEKVEYFMADKVPTKQCYFRSPAECDAARAQTEGKSDEEKKQLLYACANSN